MQHKSNLRNTLTAPEKPGNIPTSSQWLSGEGAGSWFYVEFGGTCYKITRFSPEGKIECSGLFNITNQTPFNIKLHFQFIHLSHCQRITIKQQDSVIEMERISQP